MLHNIRLTSLIKCNLHLLIVLFFLLFQNGYSQTSVHEFELKISQSTSAHEKNVLRLHLSEKYLDLDINKADSLLQEVDIKLFDQKNNGSLIRFYLASSICNRKLNRRSLAKDQAKMALALSNTISDSIVYKAKIYNALGSIADDESDMKTAISMHLKALRFAERSMNQNQVATVCAGLGRCYIFLEECDNAKKYYGRAIAIKLEQGQTDAALGRFYSNMSICYDTEGNYEQSIFYLDKSIELIKNENNIPSLITAYNNKAYTLFLIQKYDDAEIYVKKAIKKADSLALETAQMYNYSTYAEILFAQNRKSEAEAFMNKSIAISEKQNDLYLAKYNLDFMFNLYEKEGNYKEALGYYKKRSVVMDSVYSTNNRRAIERLSLEYDTENKNKEIQFLNAEKELNQSMLSKSRQLQGLFLIIAFFSVVILALLWSRHKNKVKTDLLIKETLQKSYEKKLSDTEMRALRAQMNPHFLFNSLNSINSFIIKNQQEEATEYLSKFSMLIRKVLSNSKEKRVTLANELEALSLYLELEALRFNNTFEYTITLAPNVEKDYLEVPPLIIQPYVENSIWHGLSNKKDGQGKLLVSIEQTDRILICTIEDNGIGRVSAKKLKEKNTIKQKSFGMNITKERLQHINERFTDATDVVITDLYDDDKVACGTRVEIKIVIL